MMRFGGAIEMKMIVAREKLRSWCFSLLFMGSLRPLKKMKMLVIQDSLRSWCSSLLFMGSSRPLKVCSIFICLFNVQQGNSSAVMKSRN